MTCKVAESRRRGREVEGFVDILGSRKGTCQIPPSWSCLERAVLITLSASGTMTDCSYIIAHIRGNKYNAVILVSTLVPVLTISSVDVTKAEASIKKEHIHQKLGLNVENIRAFWSHMNSTYASTCNTTSLETLICNTSSLEISCSDCWWPSA